MMNGVRMRMRFVFWTVSVVVRKSAPSTGMSPRIGIFVSEWVTTVPHEAADDHGLLIADDELGLRVALA